MAKTFEPLTGNGVASRAFLFPSIKEADIKVEVDGTAYENRGISGASASATTFTITSYNASSGGNVLFDTAPASPASIHIYRDTDVDLARATFTAGSSIKAGELNNNMTQVLYAAQEEQNQPIITSDIKDGVITSAKITNGTIVNDDINASAAIDGTKISPDFGSQTIKSSLDGNQNDQTNSALTLSHATNSNLKANHLIVDNFPSGSGTYFIQATESGVTNDRNMCLQGYGGKVKIGGNTVAPTEVLDVAGNIAVSGTVDGRNISTDGAKLDNAVTLTDTQTLTNKTLTTPVINDLSGTAVVTSGTSTSDTKVYSAKRAEERFYGVGTAEDIVSGTSWDTTDAKVATTNAIDARIIDLVDDVGGFVPIANETSFPTTNPDVNNGFGTLISVKEIQTTRTPNSNGSVSIGNGAGSGVTVTIGGCGSTVLTAGFGVIVESTTIQHIYNFHRLVPKATEVTTVAGKAAEITAVEGKLTEIEVLAASDVVSDMNALATSDNITAMDTCRDNISSITNCSTNISSVNNFGDQYQVASSNPSTDGGGNALAEGDLYFNTSANELKIYTGSSWVSGVTQTGNFALTTGNTFTGSNIHNNNVKSIFGTSSNFEIYHDGSSSIIQSNNVDNLTLKQQHSGGYLFLHGDNAHIRTSTDNEQIFEGVHNLGVKLFYNGSPKFETKSDGVKFTGTLMGDNNHGLLFGNNQDFRIRHTGSHSEITDEGTGNLRLGSNQVEIKTADLSTATSAIFVPNGAVKLYNNSVLELQTTSNGIDINPTASGNGNVTIDGAAGNTESIIFKRGGTEASRISHSNSANLILSMGSSVDSTVEIIADSGNVRLPTAGQKIQLGASEQLQIYNDGNSKIEGLTGYTRVASLNSNLLLDGSDVHIRSGDGGEKLAKFIDDGAVQLFFDGGTNTVPMFETASTGTLTKKQSKVDVDTAQNHATAYQGQDFGFLVSYDGGHATNDEGNGICFLQQYDSTDTTPIRTGAIIGYKQAATGSFGGGLKLKTQKGGANPMGTALQLTQSQDVLIPNDNAKLKIGEHSDLQLYHSGNHSFIDNAGTGNLYIRSGTDNSIWCEAGGKVKIYYNGNDRIEVGDTDVTFTANVIPFGTRDLGSSGARWDNVYTNDLHLSNEGNNNDVDGTWGSYTIQEGSEDLFLINKRNGKKYKFNLTEVS